MVEMMVEIASHHNPPNSCHFPLGGNSMTGASAEDVFFHFLSDVAASTMTTMHQLGDRGSSMQLPEVLKLRCLPDMEGNKFNLTPVDWVAKVP